VLITAGTSYTTFETDLLTNGIYLVELKGAETSQLQKLIISK
jgi:hypothetical protein